jgi:hypothetical protein
MSFSNFDPTSTFPHADLTVLTGKPSFASVQVLKRELIANAMSVHSSRGNGTMGHAVLVLGTPAYDLITGVGHAWTDPPKPDTAPIIVAGATSAQITSAHRLWERECHEWKAFTSTELALKRLLLVAVDETYISSLQDPMFGFAQVSVHSLLTHLDTTYAEVTPDDITQNLAKLSTPWDPTESMEPLWLRGVEAQRIATAGSVPITDPQLLNIFRDMLAKTGLFSLDIRDWDKLPSASRTIALFKTTFTDANKVRLRSQTFQPYGARTPAPVPAYGMANGATGGTPDTGTTTTPSILAYSASTKTSLGYCWTHGVTTNKDHNSRTCSNKGTSHKEDATIDNMLGGNNTIRRRPNETNVYIQKNPPSSRRRDGPSSPPAITPATSDDS